MAHRPRQTVKIGAIYPLSGNAASAGVHSKAAIDTAVEIINNGNPALGNLPLAKNAGLKGLGGAKVEVVFADNQGSPAVGQNQALRLITEEKVVALTGAYQSGITLTDERDFRKIRHSLSSTASRSRPISPSAASNGSSGRRRWRATSPKSISTFSRT